MRINKNVIVSGISFFAIIIFLIILFDVQFLHVREIFSTIFFLTIPGFVIMLVLKIRKIGFWEYLIYSIGLSIAFLIFIGLAINWILPAINVTDKPLSFNSLFISFFTIFTILVFIAYKRNQEISITINFLKLNWPNIAFFVMPVFFPVLSVLGAITLNNQGPNYFTMSMLIMIAIFIFLLVLFEKRLDKNIYPWAILMIGLSLLLMFSLRSWHIPAADDIGEEYYVFQLTKNNFHWGMSNWPKNAYNACLSITILPTILSIFFKINDEYIFKLIFPLIFSLTGVGIYLLSKRYVEELFATIIAFFYISQVWFIISMPALGRQEIALFFFTVALLILFNREISFVLKEILFIIFGFSIVISHYTTAYLTNFLIIFTYLGCLIISNTKIKNFLFRVFEKLGLIRKEKPNCKVCNIKWTMVLPLVIFTIFWNVWLTDTSGGIYYVLKDTFANIKGTFSREMRTEGTFIFDQLNIFYKPKNHHVILKEFAEETTLEYKNNTNLNLYLPEKYKEFELELIPTKKMPVKINSNFSSKIYLLKAVLQKLIYIFILLGAFCLLFDQMRDIKIDIEYKMLILGCLFLLGVMLILPIITLRYPLVRMYQQLLTVLSLPAVLGCLKFFRIRGAKLNIYCVIIFIIYFLFSTGFISQILGDQEPIIPLNNFGSMYNSLYTHEEEIKSIKWLSNNYNEDDLIYTDKVERRKLAAFGGIIITGPGSHGILPSIIDKNAYVCSNYANTSLENTCELYEGTYLHYKFPTHFLNQNKNLLYNNGGSKIYR